MRSNLCLPLNRSPRRTRRRLKRGDTTRRHYRGDWKRIYFQRRQRPDFLMSGWGQGLQRIEQEYAVIDAVGLAVVDSRVMMLTLLGPPLWVPSL